MMIGARSRVKNKNKEYELNILRDSLTSTRGGPRGPTKIGPTKSDKNFKVVRLDQVREKMSKI